LWQTNGKEIHLIIKNKEDLECLFGHKIDLSINNFLYWCSILLEIYMLSNPTAKTVCIAGTFNHWQPEAKALHSSGVGNWWKETALAPGSYEYCLVVDGKWMPDPHAKESVPNPFGGRNSILTVASSPEAAHLADAENLPLKNANKKNGRNT
jgi:AMP-activated protein kinase-like protein